MKKPSGFSSIELTLALTLLFVLITMAIAAYNGHLRKNRDIERVAIAEQIEILIKNYINAHAGKIPTGAELLTELRTINIWQTIVSPGDTLLGGFSGTWISTFAFVDPVGEKNVCLDDVAFASQPCQFYYIRYSDNTYSISYGIESAANMQPNFYRTTPCQTIPATPDCPYDIILGVYRGNARFIGSVTTALTHYTPIATLMVPNSEKATLLIQGSTVATDSTTPSDESLPAIP